MLASEGSRITARSPEGARRIGGPWRRSAIATRSAVAAAWSPTGRRAVAAARRRTVTAARRRAIATRSPARRRAVAARRRAITFGSTRGRAAVTAARRTACVRTGRATVAARGRPVASRWLSAGRREGAGRSTRGRTPADSSVGGELVDGERSTQWIHGRALPVIACRPPGGACRCASERGACSRSRGRRRATAREPSRRTTVPSCWRRRRPGERSGRYTETCGRHTHHGARESLVQGSRRDTRRRRSGRGRRQPGRRRAGRARGAACRRLLIHQHGPLELGGGRSLEVEAALHARGRRFGVLRPAIRTKHAPPPARSSLLLAPCARCELARRVLEGEPWAQDGRKNKRDGLTRPWSTSSRHRQAGAAIWGRDSRQGVGRLLRFVRTHGITLRALTRPGVAH
ncbi:Hypothetical protein CAP_6533 [Chondromyces apiculatus DSM 436]|uniref:Uncharacterized protein n=1 Tax=Chondromyces apiculatus DSM 436 TaxID=1192034 RepID=A0A017T0N8_9BACT|nr:Hypothetical protein CAP_6533 [Chondromyces apiculatus DSM 436]